MLYFLLYTVRDRLSAGWSVARLHLWPGCNDAVDVTSDTHTAAWLLSTSSHCVQRKCCQVCHCLLLTEIRNKLVSKLESVIQRLRRHRTVTILGIIIVFCFGRDGDSFLIASPAFRNGAPHGPNVQTWSHCHKPSYMFSGWILKDWQQPNVMSPCHQQLYGAKR